MIRIKTRLFVILTLITFFTTSAALFFELTGDRMMFFEFKSDAMTTIHQEQLPQLFSKWKTSKMDILSIPSGVFNTSHIFDINGNLILKKSDLEAVIKNIGSFQTSNKSEGFQGLLRIATSYDVWPQNTTVFSINHWFYAFNFMTILGCALQIIALIANILFMPDSVFNKNRYLIYLILCELGILLWLPFQSYSINYTKSLLFSPEFRGTLAGLNVIIYAIIATLLLATITSIYRSATKKYQPILLSFLGGSLSVGIMSSLFGAPLIDKLFGMGSTNPLTPWCAGIIFFSPLFILLVRWVDLHVGDD